MICLTILGAAPCSLNPCLNNGTCAEVNATTFTCDCSGTSYHGDKCERGIVAIDPIPELVVNNRSAEIVVTANPDSQFVVLLRSSVHWKLLLEPDFLEFSVTGTRQSFTITPRVPGDYEIWYRIGVPWDHRYYPLATVRVV